MTCCCCSHFLYESSIRPLIASAFVFSWSNSAVDTTEYWDSWCCSLASSEPLSSKIQISSAYADAFTRCSTPELKNLYLTIRLSWSTAKSRGSNAKLDGMGNRGSPCRSPCCWLTVGEKKLFTLTWKRLSKKRWWIHQMNGSWNPKAATLALNIVG